MRLFLAYALLVIGVPQLVGLLIGGTITAPIAWMIPYPARIRVIQLLRVVSGLASIMGAFLLFSLLGVAVGWSVPIILVAWVSFYYISYKQPIVELASFATGILTGWLFGSGIF